MCLAQGQNGWPLSIYRVVCVKALTMLVAFLPYVDNHCKGLDQQNVGPDLEPNFLKLL